MSTRFMTVLHKLRELSGFSEVIYSIVAMFLALLIGAILIWISGYDVIKAYSSFFQGACGNVYNLSQSVLKTIPLIFTGLAVAVGFQSGLFNIGGEGQLYWGALASAVTALTFAQLPGVLLLSLSLLAGAAAGGFWGAISGYLKAKTGAHEVVTTIMLNYIGMLATSLLLKTFFKEPGYVDQTPMIPESARFPELIPYTKLTAAIFVGIGVILLVDLMFKHSSLGYDLQAIGQNPGAAEYAGIPVKRYLVISMALSGAAAGLAGSTMVMGVLNRFITNFSPGYGFTGIAVAVLGRNKPWGVLLAALLFGALKPAGCPCSYLLKFRWI